MWFVEKILLPFRRRLVSSIVPNWSGVSAEEKAEVAEAATQYVAAALNRAPFHMQVGLTGLDVLFWLYAGIEKLLKGRRFALPDAFESWGGIFSLSSTHVRFYRSMTLLFAYEHPVGLRQVGHAPYDQHAAAYRAKRSALQEGEAP